MTRTVADAAMLLSALAGADPRDAATAARHEHAGDYTQFLDPDGPCKGARIGVARKRFFGYQPARPIAWSTPRSRRLKAQGAVIVDPADIPTAARIDDCECKILLYEFKAGPERLSRRAGAGRRQVRTRSRT